VVVAAALGCASGSSREVDRPDSCAGFVAARPKFPRMPQYPPTALRARMSGESTHEVLVDRDGKVREVHILGTTFMVFALAVDDALRKSLYFPATLDGRPVASRFWVRVPFGIPRGVESSPARNRVTVFVPGGEKPGARWQIAGSVRRLTVVAEVASAPPAEVSIVATAPGGAEHVLVPRGSATSREIRTSVRTGDFFSAAGEYRVSLRQGERTIGVGGFTVAPDEASAVVNTCGAP